MPRPISAAIIHGLSAAKVNSTKSAMVTTSTASRPQRNAIAVRSLPS